MMDAPRNSQPNERTPSYRPHRRRHEVNEARPHHRDLPPRSKYDRPPRSRSAAPPDGGGEDASWARAIDTPVGDRKLCTRETFVAGLLNISASFAGGFDRLSSEGGRRFGARGMNSNGGGGVNAGRGGNGNGTGSRGSGSSRGSGGGGADDGRDIGL